MPDLMTYFSKITDKRKPNGIRHKLLDIIIVAICGVICGSDDWVLIEYFGKAKREWFESFLDLPHGIPSHDTFGKVFALIDPQEFQKSIMDWVHELPQSQVDN